MCTSCEDLKCMICMENLDNENYKTNGCYTIEKCGHTFHTDCIFRWFFTQEGSNGNCPLCRFNPKDMFRNDYLAKVTTMRKLSLRKSSPPDLKNLGQNLRNSENKYKDATRELKKFKKENKNLLNKYLELNKNIISSRNNIYKCRDELVSFPILRLPFGNSVRLPN